MEFFHILKDIEDGALESSEIPGDLLYQLRQSFWFWFVLIVGGMLGMVIVKTFYSC